MKNIIIFVLLSIPFFNFAQKTVVIHKSENITKTTDGDGKVVVITKTMEEGDPMTDLPELDMKKDGDYLTVEKTIVNGKEASIYKLTKIKNGKNEVIAWDGEGEMPAAIKDKMKNVNINTSSNGTMKTVTIDAREDNVNQDRRNKNGEKRVVKEMRREANMDSRNLSRNENKTQLGIMLDDRGEGVKVDEVFKGSVADKAGVNKGDVILKINGDYIFSSNQLIRKIADFKASEKIDMVVLRDNKELSLKAQF